MSVNKVYFPNLNPLRFIAALLVFIHHTEQIKEYGGLPNYFNTQLVYNIGKLSVILFFTLSGFLITYLLLVEEQKTNKISIKEFYIRRILKIWPLYFFVIFLAFFLFPSLIKVPGYVIPSFTNNLLLHVLFLPNLALVLYGIVPMASQTWTVGTEEQFYLFWPWIFKARLNKYAAFLFVILGYLLVRYGLPFLSQSTYTTKFLEFWDLFNVDCMAIGGLFALILFEQRKKMLNFLYNKYFQWFIYILTPALMFFPANYEVFAVLFSIIILNLASNPNTVITLDIKPLNYLGKISYGIYMYHIAMIVFVAKGLESIGLARSIFIYPLSLLATFAVAAVSFTYFEGRFIRLKQRFTKIVSGEDAKPDSPHQKRSKLLQKEKPTQSYH